MKGRSGIMYWGIYDDCTIRRIKPKTKKSLLIRALEPSYLENGVPYKILYLDEYLAVLDLYFDDIYELIPDKVYDNRRLFNEDMALRIIEFVKKYEFDEINIHCGAGISRSSALMICVSRVIGAKSIEDKIISCERYIPNGLVLDIFNEVICDEDKLAVEDEFIHSNESEWSKESKGCNLIKNDDGTYSIIF